MDGLVDAAFGDRTESRVVSVPRSHLSIELGHFYVEDFEAGPEHLVRTLRLVAPWAQTARDLISSVVAPRKPRISTCFLVDDYFSELPAPSLLVPMLLQAAEAAGVTIDYIARESAFAQYDEIPVADLVIGRLVDDPHRGANGTRPPVRETGWLCNGVRSPQNFLDEAMRRNLDWRPPRENRSTRHSVFVDVELWRDLGGGRQWACALLAAAWQLVRLGLIRFHGAPIASPVEMPEVLSGPWSRSPAVMRVNANARPFAAYRTFSVLGGRFLTIEHAVRTILQQIAVELVVTQDVARLAAQEGLSLPGQITDRIDYAFIGDAWSPS